MDIYEQLRRDEGVRLKPYTDTVDKLTIGVGRNLTDDGITDAEATDLLSNDVASVVAQLTPLAWWSALDEVRQWALVNVAFNLGVPRLLHFPSMLHYLGLKDFDNAAAQLLDSDYARQEHYDPANPLASRPGRIAEQIRSGTWQ